MKIFILLLIAIIVALTALLYPFRNSKRYFFISYTLSERYTATKNEGQFWFSYDSFPSKNHIDSSIFSVQSKVKECYYPPHIQAFIEFKCKEDCEQFGRNYTGNWNPPAKQDTCCEWNGWIGRNNDSILISLPPTGIFYRSSINDTVTTTLRKYTNYPWKNMNIKHLIFNKHGNGYGKKPKIDLYQYYYMGKSDSFSSFQLGRDPIYYSNMPYSREYDSSPFINDDSTLMIKDDSIVRGIAPRVDTIKIKLN